MPDFTIRPLTSADHDWVRQKIVETWDAEIVVAHKTIYRPAELPGFAAESGDEIVGLLTYHVEDAACEIVTLDSWRERLGVGTALIEAVKQAACLAGCQRLFLITTNDNIHALSFYQKRGFVICAVRLNAIEQSRLVKPEISILGDSGIPIRDEIELEIVL